MQNLRNRVLVTAAVMTISVMTAPNMCFARIGETMDECQQRYGAVMSVVSGDRQDYPQFCYRMGEVNIRIRFYNGKSAQEIFNVDGRRLTDGERDLIRNGNTSSDAVWSAHSISENEDMIVITTREFEKIFNNQHGSNF
jgi:hypothetical protein